MNLSYGNPNNSSMVEFSRSADLFCAYSANVTSLPAYSATSLGPILYNGTNPTNAYPEKKVIVLGISLALTTASGAAVAVGLCWGSQLTAGNTAVPASITGTAGNGATLVSSTYPINKQPSASAYNSGNVLAAATGFWPLASLPTTAITALPVDTGWIPIDGGIVLPAGTWVALAASATATSAVLQYSILWAETTK
jgi:polygalacturonase